MLLASRNAGPQKHRVLRTIMNSAVEEELIDVNPVNIRWWTA